MDALRISATGRSPEVDFDFATGRLRLAGESYPDDVASFFGPVFDALRAYLADAEGTPVRLDVELIYFNSSTAKALMNMFQMMEAAAAEGRSIVINWTFEADDEAMREFGEDFSEDLRHVTFNLIETGH